MRCVGLFVGSTGCRVLAVDGEGNVSGFRSPFCGRVARPILIQSGDDAVTVGSNFPVQLLLRRSHPTVTVNHGFVVCAQPFANVEIAIAQRHLLAAHVDPVIVHAEGAHEHLSVVSSEITVDGHHALRFQFKEQGVDDLHDIKPSQLGQHHCQLQQIGQRPEAC